MICSHTLSLTLSDLCSTSTSTFDSKSPAFHPAYPKPTCVTIPTCCTNMSPSDEITARFLAFLVPCCDSIIGVTNDSLKRSFWHPKRVTTIHNLKNLGSCFFWILVFFWPWLHYYLGFSWCSKRSLHVEGTQSKSRLVLMYSNIRNRFLLFQFKH